MKNVKVVVIVVMSVFLVVAFVYLTLLIQDGENPLGMFGIRASNPSDEVDPFLAENNLTITPADSADVGSSEPSPTQALLAYNSSSPSPTRSVSISPAPTFTPTPTIVNKSYGNSDISPTIVKSLPVAGIIENIDKFLIGGGVLILVGLLL